jgi:hypothetical protein
MILIKYLNNYFDAELSIYTSLDKINFINEKYIITNDSLELINYHSTLKNKVYNYKINYWLNNNLMNTYKPLTVLSDVKEEIEEIKIKFNKDLLQQTNQYTVFEWEINNLFNLKYDEKKYYLLKEKDNLNRRINNGSGKKLREEFDFVEKLEKKIVYDFKNATGRIYPKGSFNLIKFNNKYIDLFIEDNNYQYYKIDFKCFYPRFLYLYTGNNIFLDDNFYDIYSEKLGVERQYFKEDLFNKFINGGVIDDKNFMDQFKYLYELKNNIKVPFLNYSGRKIYCKDYQKLGYLISTTAEDTLKYLLSHLYNKYFGNEDIKFLWLKYDEIFLALNLKCDINELTDLIKQKTNNLISCKVSEVK